MKNIIISLLVCVLGACIDTYEIALPSEPPRIVIDALISDVAGQSYVNISWSSSVNSSCTNFAGGDMKCEPSVFHGPYKVNGKVTIVEGEDERTTEMLFQMDDKAGMILLKPDVTGLPGITYHLQVDIDYNGSQEVYTSSTTMAATPQITDIVYEVREGDVGKEDNFVPLISFTEPPEKNFYLFQLCWTEGNRIYCDNSRAWSYSIIDDTFLPPNVKNLSIDDGAAIAKYTEFFPPAGPGHGAKVMMYAVDETTYSFYKGLIEQFNNDGGAYSPTPATPKGNISGNAIGLFRACQESTAVVYY